MADKQADNSNLQNYLSELNDSQPTFIFNSKILPHDNVTQFVSPYSDINGYNKFTHALGKKSSLQFVMLMPDLSAQFPNFWNNIEMFQDLPTFICITET